MINLCGYRSLVDACIVKMDYDEKERDTNGVVSEQATFIEEGKEGTLKQ